jgi:peptide/nickel transport system permease protein
MAKFLIRRIIFLLITLVVVSGAVFAISEIAPGNIAVNTLGNTITPAQEASFNAQNGLDQSSWTRYIRWMLGSDWQAERIIGHPVVRIHDEENDRFSWWAVEEDGTLFQNYTPDGETIIRVERQDDGSTSEIVTSGDVWTPNEDGLLTFWGVDQSGHAAMWVKGDDQVAWTLTKTSWNSAAGAPREYIPLQRGLLRGDPGVSFSTRRPVAETLLRRLGNTALLAGIAFLFVMPLALALGLIAGLNEGKFIDRLASISSLIATATPEFASGVFLIVLFSSAFMRQTLGIEVPTAVVITGNEPLWQSLC